MSKKILFIEDEPDQVMMVRERFQPLGYEIITAGDGETGIEKFFSENPDLVLIDVVIPKIDGIIVAKKIRASAEGKNTPLILITAAGMLDFEEKCKEAGADACIRRPYEPAELDKIVDGLLNK